MGIGMGTGGGDLGVDYRRYGNRGEALVVGNWEWIIEMALMTVELRKLLGVDSTPASGGPLGSRGMYMRYVSV